jgi:hypothetical protein
MPRQRNLLRLSLVASMGLAGLIGLAPVAGLVKTGLLVLAAVSLSLGYRLLYRSFEKADRADVAMGTAGLASATIAGVILTIAFVISRQYLGASASVVASGGVIALLVQTIRRDRGAP